MSTQSTVSQWYVQGLPKDNFSVFPLMNDTRSNGSSSPISEEVQSSFKAFSLNQSPSPTSATSPISPVKKPYSCHECGQIFSRPHNLKSHLTTHSSLRPYKCGICNHYFRRHHDLKRHQKLHTGEKPYSCNNCHRAFARLDALNRHQKSEGMTACSAAHSRKSSVSDKNASPLANCGGVKKRPNIPHIKLVNRASSYSPPRTPPHVMEVSPVICGSTSPFQRLGSLSSAFVAPIKELSPPKQVASPESISRSPTWSPPATSPLHPERILPPPHEMTNSISNQYEKLQIQNRALKQEVNIMFHGQLDDLRARVYDLEIENRVLRSLVESQKKIEDIDLELKQQKEKLLRLA